MHEQWYFLIIDGLILLVGALLSINALIQIFIELKVRNQEGRVTCSGIKLTRHLLFLILGVALIIARVIYIVDRNSWYNS